MYIQLQAPAHGNPRDLTVMVRVEARAGNTMLPVVVGSNSSCKPSPMN